MSEYLNNTALVCPLCVRLPVEGETTETDTHNDLIAVVKRLVHKEEKGANWEQEEGTFVVSPMTGGLSNVLYLVRERVKKRKHNVEEGISADKQGQEQGGDCCWPRQAIVRVFGQGTSAFIDRAAENAVFAALSQSGLGPTFYGLFQNGRVEGYLTGKRSLEAEEMSAPGVWQLIAANVARLHAMRPPPELNQPTKAPVDAKEGAQDQDRDAEEWLWAKIDRFFCLASEVVLPGKAAADDDTPATAFLAKHPYHETNCIKGVPSVVGLAAEDISVLRQEYQSMRACITAAQHQARLQHDVCNGSGSAAVTADISTSDAAASHVRHAAAAGREFAFSRTLCHNDLLSGNVMLDVEYARQVRCAAWGTGATAHVVDKSCVKDTPESNDENISILSPASLLSVARDRMTIIDYEYAAINYRAFDLANHFVEHCGVNMTLRGKHGKGHEPGAFPDQKLRKDFLRKYIDCCQQLGQFDPWVKAWGGELQHTAAFLEAFEEVVCQFLLPVHLFWAIWAVVQSGSASIDFDYRWYAALRWAAYRQQKEDFSSLFPQVLDSGQEGR